MPQRDYELTIAPDGSVELHIQGFKGKACLEALEVFRGIVGELKDQRATAEFYEPDEDVRRTLDQHR